MRRTLEKQTPRDKLRCALGEYGFLTAEQLTALLYQHGSLTYVKAQLKSLVDVGDVLAFGGRGTSLPVIYTLSGKGRRALFQHGQFRTQRFRLTETQAKAANGVFVQHTLAVNDVLIAARLLSQSMPTIELIRVYHERELKRKIAVAQPTAGGKTKQIFLEPDASLDVRIRTDTSVWRDFVHIEVYRHHPMEHRFKQKIAGYVDYAQSEQHQVLFQTRALTIALFCASPALLRLLKGWTEQVLTQLRQEEEGGRFFFRQLDASSTSPEEMFLAPVWEQAFRTDKTPLLVLE